MISEPQDPRLGRLPEFDGRSRNFNVRQIVTKEIFGRSWNIPVYLDQGWEGSCVGFSISHALAGIPARHPEVDNEFARSIYRRAQEIDEWPGEDYEGTSVLAGMKTASERGYISEYRWAFGLDDALRAICQFGPVVFGTNWLEGMMQPRPSGLLEVSGEVVGGHAYCGRGLLLRAKLKGEGPLQEVIRVRNSWGDSWGKRGDCFIKLEDMARLLADQGECAIPRENREWLPTQT